MNDNQFAALTKQISDLKGELGDQILKLYQHTEERFNQLEVKVDAKADKADVDRLLGAIDTVAKDHETEQAERGAMNHQLNRHERWHHQAADKLGMTLDYLEQ